MQSTVRNPAKQDASRAGFFDLPAEVRDMIYAECLTSSKPLKIRQDDTEISKLLGLSHFSVEGDLDVLRINHHKLRLICTTIKQEASKIFFGDNHFDLTDLDIPRNFLQQIGDGDQHLRRLSLGDSYVQEEAKRTYGLLSAKRATKLQKLIFVHRIRGQNFRTAKSYAQAVLPLLLMLHRTRRGTNETPAQDVLEIVGLTSKQIWELETERGTYKMRKWMMFRGKVMDRIRKRLSAPP